MNIIVVDFVRKTVAAGSKFLLCVRYAGNIGTMVVHFWTFAEMSFVCLQGEYECLEVSSRVAQEARSEEAEVPAMYWPPGVPATPMVRGMEPRELDEEVRDNLQ